MPLQKLGITHDDMGLMYADSFLAPLQPGAEASPYFDREQQVVYKLFDLRANGALGKKVSLLETEPECFETVPEDAVLPDTLEKLTLLNVAGGLPTEIVGLSDDIHYLIAKQPPATPYPEGFFDADRARALDALKAVPLGFPGLRSNAAVLWEFNRAWIISDLHERNVMRDSEGNPSVIDALIGAVQPAVIQQFAALRTAIDDAKRWRNGEAPAVRTAFEDVDNDVL